MYVLNGKSEKILRLLKKCGLTEYESKAYFTLLLTEKSRAGELSKKSSVPQAKIYWVIEDLRKKGLVEVYDNFPKSVTARSFGLYLGEKINEKQREISQLIEAGNEIRETVCCLKPIAIRFKGKYRVFEPKHRRKL